jgi:trehalose/maltose transport system substrate-binding protein
MCEETVMITRVKRFARRLLPIVGLMVSTPPALAAEVSLLCGAGAWPVEDCKLAVERWSAATGHRVRVVAAPADYDEHLQRLREVLVLDTDALDVVQIDVIWAGLFADQLLPLDLPGSPAAHLPATLASARVGGRLVALPFSADGGTLFYRADLLEAAGLAVPETWEALGLTALALARSNAGNGLAGYLFQGAPAEGLTTNLIEWLVSAGAAPLVDADGRAGANRATAAALIDNIALWIGLQTPLATLLAGEAEVVEEYAAGGAAFMRNWLSAWPQLAAAAPEIAASTGMAALPAGPAGRAATLGGWSIGVAANSRVPEAAIDLARFLTGEDEQRRRALTLGLPPTRLDLLNDPTVQAAHPALQVAAEVLAHAVARPSAIAGSSYQVLSREVTAEIHAVLRGEAAAGTALAAIDRRIERLSGGGQRW